MQILEHLQIALNLPFDVVARAVRFSVTPDGKAASILSWDKTVLGDAVPADADLAAILALPDPLPPLQVKLKAQVDDAAEALRLTLITPGSGQAMEYQEAFNEAVQVSNTLAANASAVIDATKFPMLSASLGFDVDPTTGKPTVDVPGEARAVLAAYDAYQKAGAAIRAARLKGKAAIDAATTPDAAQAAFAAVAWPTLG